jgi:hypothetical protein
VLPTVREAQSRRLWRALWRVGIVTADQQEGYGAMPYSPQSLSSGHGRDFFKGQLAGLCRNDALVTRKTILAAVSISHACRRSIPRVKYFEVCFGTVSPRGARIMLNRKLRNMDSLLTQISSDRDQCVICGHPLKPAIMRNTRKVRNLDRQRTIPLQSTKFYDEIIGHASIQVQRLCVLREYGVSR